MGQIPNPRTVAAPRPVRGPWVQPSWPGSPAGPAVSAGMEPDELSPGRKFAFKSGLAMVFVTFGILAEVLLSILHTNTYVLYLVGPPALIGVIMSGGIGRLFRHRAARYWTIFFILMIVAAPFSSWRGASLQRVMDYARFSFPLLFVVGGTARNWNEIRALFYTVAGAAMVNLVAARLFATNDNGRLSMDASGTIGNSNDLAAHLVLVLPFIFYIVIDRKRNALLRYSLLGPIGYGIWVILGTASRGALIALGVVFLLMLLRASMWQRLQVIVIGVVMAIFVPALLPPETLLRLASLFGEEHEEADSSRESRSYLLKQSIIYTFEHPILGVGPDQFGNYEGKAMAAAGKRGEWHATHCAYTQVSSECGIPALIFFVMGIGSALLTVNRLWRAARKGGYKDIANACYCYMLSMIGFLTTITFLADAYRFYLPAMVGLAIAMGSVGERYMRENPPAGGTSVPQGQLAYR